MTRSPIARALPCLLALAAAALPAAALSHRQAALAAFERENAGVSYEFGECTSTRMDCSCFVQRLYAEKFGHFLPRTTLTQVSSMERSRVRSITRPSQLADRNLCVGDLIYTHRPGRSWWQGSRHVVVYVGNDRVLHASSNNGGIGTDRLSWLKGYSLRGVYRPIGCEADRAPGRSPAPRPFPPRRPADDEAAPVRAVIDSLFRSWETRDFALYRRCWSPGAVQWIHGRQRTLQEVLHHRRRLFESLVAARQSHRIVEVTVWGDHAIAEVVYSLDLTRRNGRRVRERNVRESYVLARAGGRWRITHNEAYQGE